ncbi:bZIP transcription factor 12-like isoform X1 [Zingiber officinale]|uniref:bZIP transcription factor 12-like isoform X1 n=1 Tax=Zingiber officinale TaxID=94328 RepID=UPI001C4C42C0|nr:bZIP transcription factor 12-like isoform X1 [Zingiber officinale]
MSSSMASSRVMLSSSSPASDLARLPDAVAAKGFGSMSVEELLRNASGGGLDGAGKSFPLPKSVGGRTVEDMRWEIAANRGADGSGGEMTLEDFLAKASVVGMEDVVIPTGWSQVALAANHATREGFGEPRNLLLENPAIGFGNGEEGVVRAERGRKRPLSDPVDRMAIQREKRMIKNRESAARSRERKQAYINQLEASVAKLEEDNARLLRCLEQQQRMRLKKLMENVLPVTEKRRPSPSLRRTSSMECLKLKFEL